MLQDSALDPHEPANDFVAEEAQGGHADGHEDVGAILRRARMQSGYTLEQVSHNLNIRVQHVAAIEESRVSDLPGLPYAVGFVKAYANFLGLDEHAIVARYKEEVQLVPGAQRLVFPEPVDEARVPKGTVIALSLAAALAIYGVWHFVSSYDGVKMVTVPDVPDRLAMDAVGPKSIAPAVTAGTDAASAPDASKAEVSAATAAPAPAPALAKAEEKAVANAAPVTEAPKAVPVAKVAEPQVAQTATAEKTVQKAASVAVAAVAPKVPVQTAEDVQGEDSELPTPPVDAAGTEQPAPDQVVAPEQAVASAEAPGAGSGRADRRRGSPGRDRSASYSKGLWRQRRRRAGGHSRRDGFMGSS